MRHERRATKATFAAVAVVEIDPEMPMNAIRKRG
jgi:hypothetical protein